MRRTDGSQGGSGDPAAHVIKAEDIINHGGATLVVELFGSDNRGGFAEDRGGTVSCDGIRRDFAPGERLRLAPGESVTLRPGDWHAFWGEGGDVLIGEVSTVNDDEADSIICEPIGRFAQIEEDEPPTHLLVSGYRTWRERVAFSRSHATRCDTLMSHVRDAQNRFPFLRGML